MSTVMDVPILADPTPGLPEEWDKLHVDAKFVQSPGELWIHVKGTYEDRNHDWMVRGNNPDHFVATTAEAAHALGVAADMLEAKLVPEVLRNRRAWLRLREESGSVPKNDAAKVEVAKNVKDDDGFAFHGDFTDCVEFMGQKFEHQWLVNKVLVQGQTTVIGGPKKALKSSVAIDLALCITFGKPFLGTFEVTKPRKVALITAESGEATIQSTIRRIATARGIEYVPGMLYLYFRMPRLGDDKALATLKKALVNYGIEVVIFDPLYLALAGNADTNPANLYSIGPLILKAAKGCLDVGATPIFVHHTTKSSHAKKGRHGEALDLDDLAFAGIAEACRQWWVVSHREEFDPVTGTSKLWLRVGGSAGHAGLYAVDVCEGVMLDDFSGRGWKVTVQPAAKAIEAEKLVKASKKATEKEQTQQAEFTKVLEVFKDKTAKTAPDIATSVGLSADTVRSRLKVMRQHGLVQTATIAKPFGKGTRNFEGWELGPRAEQYLIEQQRALALQPAARGTIARPG